MSILQSVWILLNERQRVTTGAGRLYNRYYNYSRKARKRGALPQSSQAAKKAKTDYNWPRTLIHGDLVNSRPISMILQTVLCFYYFDYLLFYSVLAVAPLRPSTNVNSAVMNG